jgi:uncharacterized membrane protein AbrB (regulator of aidB expression)
VNRVWQALIIGGVFVGIVEVLGYRHMATPMPFWLLLPGVIAAACVPGSGFNLKTTQHLSPVFYLVFYPVNVAIYAGLAYLMLRFSSKDSPYASK